MKKMKSKFFGSFENDVLDATRNISFGKFGSTFNSFKIAETTSTKLLQQYCEEVRHIN
jgi:hypothetical protein